MAGYYDIYKKLVRSNEMRRMSNSHVPHGRSFTAIAQSLESSSAYGAQLLGFNGESVDLTSVLAILESLTYVPYGTLGEEYMSNKLKAHGKDIDVVRKEAMRDILRKNGIEISPELDKEIDVLVDSKKESITPVTPGCVVSAVSQISSRQDELLLDPKISGKTSVDMAYQAIRSMQADLTPKVSFINVEKYIKDMPSKSDLALSQNAMELLDSLDYTHSKQKEN